MRYAVDPSGETVDAQSGMTEYHRTNAIVLAIGNRFFHGWSKTGRAQIAWSVAGAMLIGPGADESKIGAIETRLRRLGHAPVRRLVTLVSVVDAVLPAGKV